MADISFYDNLDLKYPEIAIAIDKIDRTNPGKIRFIIPVLTPGVDTSKPVDRSVNQLTTNLLNENKTAIGIKNITISNYIEIELPKELCAFVGGKFNVDGTLSMSGYGNNSFSGNMNYNADGSYTGSQSMSGNSSIDGSISGSGSVVIDNPDRVSLEGKVSGSINSNGDIDGSINANLSGSISGSMRQEGNGSYSVQGTLNIIPTDEYRYIAPGSKWIVIFVGGDIDKPRIIAPYGT